MAKDLIGYNDRARNALLAMLRDVLMETTQKGLQGAHHFYITYDTQAPGVVISDDLRESHPEEITIVLQNQFEDLVVSEDSFTVRLSFNHRPETLVVPFQAITRFYDPGVSFGLSFEQFAPQASNIANIAQDELFDNDRAEHMQNKTQGQMGDKMGHKTKDKIVAQDGVISLDAFRKNKQ